MTLHDISNGPAWLIWGILGLLIIMTIIFLSGKGSSLIAGFNTMSEKEQEAYDKKKLCRVYGYGFTIIDVLIFIMLLGEKIFPAWSVSLFLILIILDIIGMIVVGSLKCKK